MADPVNVLLVGRNAIVREGLSRILSDNGFRVLQSVSTIADLCRLPTDPQQDVDLIVVDPVAWIADENEICEVKERFPSARIVALMDTFDFDAMVAALRAGAHGLLVTEISCAGLILSLRLTAKGERILPSLLADLLPPYVSDAPWEPDASIRGTNLSPREIEILRCLIMGCPNTLISRRLGISEAAVKVHVKAVLRKIPVKNRTQAAIWAVKQGITAVGVPICEPEEILAPAPPVPVFAAQAMQQALEPA
jgi:two-component system, NarL family, nitrate/nitrite response regulator NarL